MAAVERLEGPGIARLIGEHERFVRGPLHAPRLSRRIGGKSQSRAGERLRAIAHRRVRLADHTPGYKVRIAVVVERDALGRRAGGAFEGDLSHLRVLAAPVAGSELRLGLSARR